ncbi:hypothetical protein SVIOM342S_06735 [Streptomyces violaceorubidus]
MLGARHHHPVPVDHLGGDEDQGAAVGVDALAVRGEAQGVRRPGGAQDVGGDRPAAAPGDGLQLARLEGHPPGQVQLARAAVRAGVAAGVGAVGEGLVVAGGLGGLQVGPAVDGLLGVEAAGAERIPVQVQLDGVDIGVRPDLDGVALAVVPRRRQQVDHRLVRPLAAEQVVHVLREPGRVDRAEEGRLHREDVVRRGLPDVVDAGPQELPGEPPAVPVLLVAVLAAHRPGGEVVVVGGGGPPARGVVLAGVQVLGLLVGAARGGLGGRRTRTGTGAGRPRAGRPPTWRCCS